MFNTNKKFKKLIESDRYKKSKYVFQKVNGSYGIKNKLTNNYADLRSYGYEWEYGHPFTKDCFGSISDIMSLFNFLCPIIDPINIEEVF